MNENNIKLTENAHKQLELFKDNQVRKLIDIIVKDKFYPGIEFIEITGNDISQYEKQVVFGLNKKSYILKTLALVYLFIGVFCILFGVFYNEILYIAFNNPKQLIIIIMGISMVIISLFIIYRENIRKRIIENILNKQS